MSDLFEIRPLKWQRESDSDFIRHRANTTFGYFTVSKEKGKISALYSIRYCFDEYYDEGSLKDGKTFKEAKQIAWEYWVERISTGLDRIR